MKASRRVGSIWNRPFFVLTLLLTTTLLASSREEPTTTRTVPSAPLLTRTTTLEVEQGELLFFVGENRVRVQPRAWQTTPEGHIGFRLSHEAIDYRFALQAANVTVGEASRMMARVTVTASADEESVATVWFAWRSQVVRSDPAATRGFLLHAGIEETERDTAPLPWNERWTWFFEDAFFMRDRFALYGIPGAGSWTLEPAVRLEPVPSNPLERSTIIGFTKAVAPVHPDEASVTVLVPYRPLDRDEWRSWINSLHVEAEDIPDEAQ